MLRKLLIFRWIFRAGAEKWSSISIPRKLFPPKWKFGGNVGSLSWPYIKAPWTGHKLGHSADHRGHECETSCIEQRWPSGPHIGGACLYEKNSHCFSYSFRPMGWTKVSFYGQLVNRLGRLFISLLDPYSRLCPLMPPQWYICGTPSKSII